MPTSFHREFDIADLIWSVSVVDLMRIISSFIFHYVFKKRNHNALLVGFRWILFTSPASSCLNLKHSFEHFFFEFLAFVPFLISLLNFLFLWWFQNEFILDDLKLMWTNFSYRKGSKAIFSLGSHVACNSNAET